MDKKKIVMKTTWILLAVVILFGTGRLIYREAYTKGYKHGIITQWEEDKKLINKGIEAMDEAIETLDGIELLEE